LLDGAGSPQAPSSPFFFQACAELNRRRAGRSNPDAAPSARPLNFYEDHRWCAHSISTRKRLAGSRRVANRTAIITAATTITVTTITPGTTAASSTLGRQTRAERGIGTFEAFPTIPRVAPQARADALRYHPNPRWQTIRDARAQDRPGSGRVALASSAPRHWQYRNNMVCCADVLTNWRRDMMHTRFLDGWRLPVWTILQTGGRR
jgi:hypothetical protein